MNDKLHHWSMMLVLVLACACSSDEETLLAVTIEQITPGSTMMGGPTLNTAMIGDTMKISGQNFSPVPSENRVSVSDVPAEVIASSPTEIKAKVPEGVPFSLVEVVVRRLGYQEAIHNISVKETESPSIIGISPTQGPIGTIVTIYGKNLEETLVSNVIAFPNAKDTTVAHIYPFEPVSAASDSIKVIVPEDAGTGAITLYAKPRQDIDSQFFGIVTPPFTVTPR